MRITSDGLVGSGTSNPPYKLTVDSNDVFLRGRRRIVHVTGSDFAVSGAGLTINAYDDGGTRIFADINVRVYFRCV